MMRRWGIWTLILSLAALVIGFSIGLTSSSDYPVTSSPAPESAEPELRLRAQLSHPPVSRPDTEKSGRIGRPPGKTGRPARSVENLEQRLEFGRILLEGYRAEVEGVVQEWTPELRERFNQEKFREVVNRVQDSCDLPGELIDLDCSEPPCLAVFRLNEDQVRSSAWYYGKAGTPVCEAWESEYTRGMFLMPDLVNCPGGGHEWFAVLAPSFYWEGVTQRDVENNGKRIEARAGAVKEKWRCSAF